MAEIQVLQPMIRGHELFVERAAQLEYDANLPREEAEQRAMEEVEAEKLSNLLRNSS